MSEPFKDPIVTIKTRSSVYGGSLSDLVYEADQDNLVSLPRMRAEQRPQVVTTLAILHHLTKRYGGKIENDTLKNLVRELPDLPLYPIDAPGFLQANFPTQFRAADKDGKTVGWQDASPLFMGIGHLAKMTSVEHPRDEELMFNIIAAGDRRYVSKTPGGVRWAMLAAFPSADGTMGSEILALSSAYEQCVEREGDAYILHKPGTCIADHFPFLLDGDLVISPKMIAWPYVDSFRPIRMTNRNGRAEVVKIDWDRFKPLGDLPPTEPHLAVRLAAGKEKEKYFRARAEITDRDIWAVVYGRETTFIQRKKQVRKTVVHKAPIMSLLEESDDFGFVRVCGTGSANGKTLGYREEKVRFHGRIDGYVISEAARQALFVIDRTSNILSRRLLGISELVVTSGLDEFNYLMKTHVHPWVQSVESIDDLEEKIGHFHKIAFENALNAFDAALTDFRSTGDKWLSGINHRIWLEKTLRKEFNITSSKEDKSMEHHKDAASKYIAMALRLVHEIGGSNSETAKSIRGTSNAEMPGIAFFKLVSCLEMSEAKTIAQMTALRGVTECAAQVSHGKGSRLGNDLHRIDLSVDRVERLLEENGSALIQSIKDIAYAARSKNLKSFNWTYPAALILADADANGEAIRILKSKIAIAYCRQNS
jgi:hypothetical protein